MISQLQRNNETIIVFNLDDTAEKIAADKLLPLARSMRAMHMGGYHIVICTARVMGEHDLQFLKDNRMPYHALLSRAEGDTRKDGDVKVDLLWQYMINRGYADIREVNIIVFDDNRSVLGALKS